MVFASSAIILKDKKILLILRSNYTETFPHHWACPGGRGEDGKESPEKIVVREVEEEVGLNFKPTRLFLTGEYKDRKLYRYFGEWSGKIRIQEIEIDDYKWFSYDEAKNIKLAFDYKEVIDKLHEEDLI